MKLLPGDHVAQAGLTDEQYHAIAKKFMEAGAISNEYRSKRVHSEWLYFGWMPERGLFHGDRAFEQLGENGRLLTPSQILEDIWHKRGELPPVGCEVKVVAPAFALDSLSRFSGKECLVVGHFNDGGKSGYVLSHKTNGVGAFFLCYGVIEPLRTPKEKAIDAAYEKLEAVRKRHESSRVMATELYEAGLLKEVE